MTSFRELLGAEAWDIAEEAGVDYDVDGWVKGYKPEAFLQALVDQGALIIEQQVVNALGQQIPFGAPRPKSYDHVARLVSLWRTVEPT